MSLLHTHNNHRTVSQTCTFSSIDSTMNNSLCRRSGLDLPSHLNFFLEYGCSIFLYNADALPSKKGEGGLTKRTYSPPLRTCASCSFSLVVINLSCQHHSETFPFYKILCFFISSPLSPCLLQRACVAALVVRNHVGRTEGNQKNG